MNSQVATLSFFDKAPLIGKLQFQIEATRLPDGPFGQRAKPILPITFDFFGSAITAAEVLASI